MPNWITANRSSARIGNASANSVSAWPCSDRISILRRTLVTGVLSFGLGSGAGPFSRRGPLPEELRFLAGQNAGDVLDRAADVVRQERDGTDHGQRDHGKNHAVLRHRLTLLALAQRVGGDLHEGEELQQLCHLPSSVIDAHAVAREFPWETAVERRWKESRLLVRAMRLVTPEITSEVLGVAAPPKAQLRRSSFRSRGWCIPRSSDLLEKSLIRGRCRPRRGSIVLTRPYGPRMRN